MASMADLGYPEVLKPGTGNSGAYKSQADSLQHQLALGLGAVQTPWAALSDPSCRRSISKRLIAYKSTEINLICRCQCPE
jgi:hypothetical protein